MMIVDSAFFPPTFTGEAGTRVGNGKTDSVGNEVTVGESEANVAPTCRMARRFTQIN
ncbi:hypothetical protein AGMMS49983_09640 [Clostridia bacterium]|nr:hypothetical protein AGMMS49983_09640 [Clostridia bacterium]